jgi:alkanesulfonate monooxygenase SsuD/methylene tetrahydromethanopterin reductase-like flavin-dependent oxidoreductase (luciferase family)
LHDTVWFEIQGVPAVSIASSEFRDAAATQAKALGMLDAKCVFVAHPIQDATDAEMRTKAEQIVSQVIDALTRS